MDARSTMKTKSRQIRECLRCAYAKEVLGDVVDIFDKTGSMWEASKRLKDCPCRERLRRITRTFTRVLRPQEIEGRVEVYEQSILMDMEQECRLYEDYFDSDYNDGEAEEKRVYYVISSNDTQRRLYQYTNLVREKWMGNLMDHEKGRQEIGELTPLAERVVHDFCEIRYTDGYVWYLSDRKAAKSQEPSVTCTQGGCYPDAEKVKGQVRLTALIKEFMPLAARVGKLSKERQDVFWAFYDHAPTHFGSNLSILMDEKDMSAHDLFMLVRSYSRNEKMGMSVIQSMMQCRYPERNTELIPYLSRALLVEEAVLLSGTGKSWGTWAYPLDTGFLERTMENPRGKVVKVREEVRQAIVKIIQSDERLQDFLDAAAMGDDPQARVLYTQGEIKLYESRSERWYYLREKESVYTLLRCLERTEKGI